MTTAHEMGSANGRAQQRIAPAGMGRRLIGHRRNVDDVLNQRKIRLFYRRYDDRTVDADATRAITRMPRWGLRSGCRHIGRFVATKLLGRTDLLDTHQMIRFGVDLAKTR